MAQDTRSVSEQFRRQGELAREREPHKPTMRVHIEGLVDEEMVRSIVREELERVVGLVIKGLSE